VLAHAAGGKHALDNYLAAQGLCNSCRWFYSPEGFEWILRMGIWARKQMEDKKMRIGLDMLPAFCFQLAFRRDWSIGPDLLAAVRFK